MPSVDIKPGVCDAFRVLALRGVKAVSTAAPIVLSSGDGSSGGGSSGGGQSSGGGSGGSNSSRALRIPTTLKGIGEKSLLDYPTPEIRRTAAARMDENPRDARWFSGACYPHNTVQAGAPHSVALYSCSSGVQIDSAEKKTVANRLWRAAKGRWADSLGGAHSQSEEEGEEEAAAASGAGAASGGASARPRVPAPASAPARARAPAPAPTPAPAAGPAAGDASALAATQQQLAQLQAQLQAAQAQIQLQAAQAAVAPTTASAAPATPAASAAPAAAQQGVHSGGDISSPPGDVRAIQKRLAGLQRAQMRNCTDAREEQIGELEYELDERKRKFRKYGHW